MNDDIRDMAVDGLEFALDQFTDSDVVKDIPIIGSLVKLWRMKTTISDRIFLSKMRIFLSRTKSIDLAAAREWRQWMAENPKETTKIAENVVLCLEAQSDLEKCEVIGHLFKKLVENKIPRDTFDRLIHAVTQVYIEDLSDLAHFDGSQIYFMGTGIVGKLEHVGFVYESQIIEKPAFATHVEYHVEHNNRFHIAPLGQLFIDAMSDYEWDPRWKAKKFDFDTKGDGFAYKIIRVDR